MATNEKCAHRPEKLGNRWVCSACGEDVGATPIGFKSPEYEYITREFPTDKKTWADPLEKDLRAEGWEPVFCERHISGTFAVYRRDRPVVAKPVCKDCGEPACPGGFLCPVKVGREARNL